MRRVIGLLYCLNVLFLLTTGACLAGTAGQIDDLLVQEKYAEVRALHIAELDQPHRRLAALEGLFELAIESNAAVGAEEITRWIDELSSLRRARDGENARSLAALLTWNAEGAFRRKDLAEANRLVQQATTLLAEGSGRIGNSERAYVETFAAQLTGLQGHFDDALVHTQRAIELVDKPKNVLERQRLIRALYFRAMFQDRNGAYVDAIASAQRGMRENAVSAGTARNGNRRRLIGILAEILISRGDYREVQHLMLPELAALRAQDAPSPRDMAYTLGHLAEAERHLGDRDGALIHSRESADFAAKDPGIVASGSYAAILGNLGALAFEMGHYAEADQALSKNLQLTEQQFGPDSVRVVAPLISAGEVALERDLVDVAEKNFRRALSIVATQLGPQHPEGTPALRGLGNALLRSGHADQAEPLLAGAYAQRRASIGDMHPELLAWRCDLALAEARNGHADQAWESALAVEQARTQLVASIAPALGETQSLDFKRNLGHCSGLMLSLAAKRGDASSVLAAWTEVAAARGLATRIGMARLSAARLAADPERRAQWDAWRTAAQSYARALTEGATEEDLVPLRNRVDVVIGEMGASADAGANLDHPLAQLLRALPAESSLLAYVKDSTIPLLDKAATGSAHASRLFVFVVTDKSQPRLLDLGDSAAVDALAERWYGGLLHPNAPVEELRSAGLALRARIFDPLELANSSRLLIVPDADLFRVNFAALPAEAGDGYLIEKGLRTHTLETEHDLMGVAATASDSASILLIGAPDGRTGSRLAQLRGSCPTLGAALAPLPGAQREIDSLAQLARGVGGHPVTALSGSAATTDAVLRSSPQAGIIHFATHAFELGATCTPLLADSGRRGVGLRHDDTEATDARGALARQAALVLSANADSSGLMFDADIATLSLDRASWVVLSACDTGLGARLDDEGIFGLRRAFRLAGARTVLMSLWPVDDSATAVWMDVLYKARLVDKRSTLDSVADANLAVLAGRRARGESTHPFYWAGFIASGDWR
ncbi:MAG: CHAT domain-containing protein [Tahibacter sp.]